MSKNLNVRFQLRNDTAANWTTANPTLLAGEIGIETDTKKFKFGDGNTEWTKLGYAGVDEAQINALIAATEDNYYEVIPTEVEGVMQTDAQALAATVAAPSKGDIAVVKRVISADGIGNSSSYTSYVYNGTAWAATDGNYSAENVYFPDDLMSTYAFGNVTLNNGQATISAKDKNLIDVWNAMYVKETNTNLQNTAPSASIGGITADNYLLIGATSSAQTATISLNSGSYDYGYGYVTDKNEENIVAGTDAKTVVTSGTGAEADTYTFTIDGVAQTSTTASNVFSVPAVTKSTEGSHVIKAKVGYKNCGNPVSNLKKIYPAQAYADATTAEVSKTVNRWYIPFYQGFTFSDSVIDTTNITAADITGGLTAPAKQTADGKVVSTSQNVKNTGSAAFNKTKCTKAAASKAWRQYFVAYPKAWGYDMADAKDSNGIDCTVNGPVEVTIAHNNIDVVYNVYYINNAADYGTLGITWSIN